MPTPHPVWNAIKRGMFLGGLVGLNLAFLFIANSYYPANYGEPVFSYIWIGGGTGLFMGALLGLMWRRVQGPLSRLEADLKAAAALRDKGLIDDVDFRSLKMRILAAYQPDPGGARTVLATMGWMCLIGITIALGSMVDDHGAWAYDSALMLVLALVIVGAGIGTAAAAIIQTALERGGAAAGKTSTPSMLGAGGFDPLGSREAEVQRVAKAARGR